MHSSMILNSLELKAKNHLTYGSSGSSMLRGNVVKYPSLDILHAKAKPRLEVKYVDIPMSLKMSQQES